MKLSDMKLSELRVRRLIAGAAAGVLIIPVMAAVSAAQLPPQARGCNGIPTIVGTEGNDVLAGTPGDDIIFGLGGDDVIRGLGGNDWLCGGDGNDKMFGGGGDDTIEGGSGDDRIFGQSGADRARGDEGNDRVKGGEGGDVLDGGMGNDWVVGGLGNDRLSGANGRDKMRGGPGDDVIVGGVGFDPTNGGTGNDVCEAGPRQRARCETVERVSYWDLEFTIAYNGLREPDFSNGSVEVTLAASAFDSLPVSQVTVSGTEFVVTVPRTSGRLSYENVDPVSGIRTFGSVDIYENQAGPITVNVIDDEVVY